MTAPATDRRAFSYQDREYDFEPESLRFAPRGVTNPRLAEHFDSVDPHAAAGRPLPAGGISFITLNVAHDCNMACPYCFAKQGLYGGKARELMTPQNARKAVDWLFQQAGQKPEVYLRFLGGEPFMNVPVMRVAAEYARQKAQETGKRVYLSVNTNGTLFNKKVEALLSDYPMTVSISMDGTEAAHNRFRIYPNGTGTYDTVIANVPKFLAIDPYTMVNATLAADNLEVDEYAGLFRSLGINLIRFAMVGTSMPEIAIAKEEKLGQLIAAYDRLATVYRDQLLAGDVWYLADFYKYFGNFRTLQRRFNRCGAGTSYVNVDVSGNVNLCHRFTTDKTQRVGHVSKQRVAVPVSITRRDQLRETSATVPSGPEVSTLTNAPGANALRLTGVREADGTRGIPAHLHKQLDGTPFFEQVESTAAVGKANVCSVCDIRHLCGGSCFHDGEILYGDLFGGPDGFKCETDRHLAKIAMWLLDAIYARDTELLTKLDDLHLRSQQHHVD